MTAWVQTERGISYVQTDKHGLRDREHPFSKPPHTFRIAVLRDSYSEALHVPEDKAFWSVMERELKTRLPVRIETEVLNFGVGGYGIAQELITLRNHVWQYEPDIVLLAFCIENDGFNNLRELNPTRADDAPYFLLKDGALVPQDSFGGAVGIHRLALLFGRTLADWLKHLRLVQVIDAAFRKGKLRRAQKRWEEQLEEVGIENPEAAPYLLPKHPMHQDAWRITQALLIKMRERSTYL